MNASRILAEAMQLSEDEREELASALLDSVEPPPGVSIEDTEELERRAADAWQGKAGVDWDEVKRSVKG